MTVITNVSEEVGKVSNFVFSQLFKDFNSPNANLFVFDNVSVTLNLGSTTTSTFAGELRMVGLLAPLKNLLGSSDALPVTASLETAVGLTEKIAPNKLTLSGVAPFHVQLFEGVTLTNLTLQVVMAKEGDSWIFTPTLIGILNVYGITDTTEGTILLQVSLENDSLKLSAEGKHITGAFGLSQLVLDQIKISGSVGTEKELAISSQFEVGATVFNFDGIVTPTAVGMIASAKGFTLNDLAAVFKEVSPDKLNLPDFDVTFTNTSIGFASGKCTVGGKNLEKGLSLATELTAHEHTVSATADITPDSVVFSGEVGNLIVGPVTIKEAGLKFEIYKGASGTPSLFTFYGATEIQNVTVDAGVYFEKQPSSWVTMLYADVSATHLSLSTFFPEAKGSVMDQLALSKMSFVFASADCNPQSLPFVSSVKKGLQLIAVVNEIPGLNDLTEQGNADLVLTAHIGNTIDISVALPDTRLNLGSSVTTDPLEIALIIAPVPSIAVIFGMEVAIPNQVKPLHFDMMLDISPIEATGSVTMGNWWYNPFGVNGLKIGPNVAMQLGINYVQFAASGTPSTFGLAGGLAIGNTVMDMAVNISTNPMDEILSGSLKELDLKEIVVFATDTVGLTIPEDDIPDFLDIKNLQFYVAPAGGSIGTITYEKGMSFACDMVFMEKEFQFYSRISDNGIEGEGKLDAIEIGPLKVSGEVGDSVSCGLSLTPSAQSFSLDGAISFLGSKKGAYIDVSTKGIEFKFEENFFNHLKFQIDGKSTGSISQPSSLDFQLSADMQNDITDFLKNDVSNQIHTVLNSSSEDINVAKKKVEDAERVYAAEYNKAQKALDDAQAAADAYLNQLKADVNKANADYQREVGNAQNELNKAEAAYNKAFNDAKNAVAQAERDYNSGIASAQEAVNQAERDYNSGITSAQNAVAQAERDYKNAIKSAQNAVDSAQGSVNSLLGEINSTKRAINKLKWYEKPYAAVLGTKLGGLYTAYGVATGALTTAKTFLEGVKYGGSYVAFQSAQTALQGAKTGAKYTTFEGAKAGLQVAKTGAKYIAFESAKTTLTAVQYGSEYTAWQAAEKTLSETKIAGSFAINAANQAMNTIGSSAVYVALNTAKEGLKAVEVGSSAVAFGSAKAALEAAKAGSKEILGLAEYIARHSGDIFDVKSMHISGSFKGLEKGDLFKADIKVAVLNTNYDWNIDLDIQNVASFIAKMFTKAFAEAKAIAGH
nr:hypothetical protein [Cytophagales bacterium]